MKKLLLLIFLILFTAHLPAQLKSSAVKIGTYSPSAAGTGFIIGYEGGMFVDRYFAFGWSIDWFHRNYVDGRVVEDFNSIYGVPGSSINELRAKTNIHDFPAMLSASVKYPINPSAEFFLTGGIGAEILLINYRDFLNPEQDDFKTAFDLNWRIGMGAAYALAKSADLFVELTYHSSQPGWEYQIRDPNSGIDRTYERLFDMSGIIARLGFRFYY